MLPQLGFWLKPEFRVGGGRSGWCLWLMWRASVRPIQAKCDGSWCAIPTAGTKQRGMYCGATTAGLCASRVRWRGSRARCRFARRRRLGSSTSADTKVPHLGLRWGIALFAYFSVGVSIARPFELTFFLSSTLSTAYMTISTRPPPRMSALRFLASPGFTVTRSRRPSFR